MNLPLIRSGCFALACSLSSSLAESPPEKAPDFLKLEAKLDELRQAEKVPGMSAAVARGDVILWSHGFGLADGSANKPATPDTVFHLASLTKPMAAVVVMQLAHEKKIDLDAPVSDFKIKLESPGVVKVRHLLSHTSRGNPGESYRYDGSRFALLEQVVKEATGNSFATEAGRRLLVPLKLDATSPCPGNPEACASANRDPATVQGKLAQGYKADGVSTIDYRKSFSPAAGMVSTVGDYIRFSAALDGGKLLPRETLDQMYAAARNPAGKPLPYGLGWFVHERNGLKMLWHYGWWDGVSALVIKIPERNLTFVALANSDGLSRRFELDKSSDVSRSPFGAAFLKAFGL